VKYLVDVPSQVDDEEERMLAEAVAAAEALGADRNESLGVPQVEVRGVNVPSDAGRTN
jgi:hypothetical protein